MSKKVFFKQSHLDTWDRHLAPATQGWAYPGDMLGGTFNGISTGFLMEYLYPDTIGATVGMAKFVAASAGGDLATPVAYWLKKAPFRLRVGSTNANAIAASTSGLVTHSSTDTEARGLLRLNLADVNAAAQILLDQGDFNDITTSKSFELNIHFSSVTNGSIAVANGSAEFGVIGGTLGVDPTAVMNASGVHIAISDGQIRSYSVTTTATLLATRVLPSTPFVVTFRYDASSRKIWIELDRQPMGSFTIPTTGTVAQIAGRVMHQAAYTAASHAPIGVDIDGIIFTQPN